MVLISHFYCQIVFSEFMSFESVLTEQYSKYFTRQCNTINIICFEKLFWDWMWFMENRNIHGYEWVLSTEHFKGVGGKEGQALPYHRLLAGIFLSLSNVVSPFFYFFFLSFVVFFPFGSLCQSWAEGEHVQLLLRNKCIVWSFIFLYLQKQMIQKDRVVWSRKKFKQKEVCVKERGKVTERGRPLR